MARAFRFRLEPALKLRRHREDERKRIVAGTLREIAALQREHGQVRQRIQDQRLELRAGSEEGAVRLGDVARRRYWVGHLQRTLLETEARIRALQARLAQERADLTESAKQRKILSTLADRQRERFRFALARAERAEADELGTMIFRLQQGDLADE